MQHFDISSTREGARPLGRLTYGDCRQYGVSHFEVQTVHMEIRALSLGLKHLRSSLRLVPIGPDEIVSSHLSSFIMKDVELDSTSLSCKKIMKFLTLNLLLDETGNFEAEVGPPHRAELNYHYATLEGLVSDNLSCDQWSNLSPSHNPRLSLLLIENGALRSMNFMQCACRLERWELLTFILQKQPHLINSLQAAEIDLIILHDRASLYKLHLMHRVPSRLQLKQHLKLAHELQAHTISRFLLETYDCFQIEDMFFEALSQGRVATFNALYPRLIPYTHIQAVSELPHLGHRLNRAIFDRLWADYPKACSDILLKRSSAPCVAPWTWISASIDLDWPKVRFIQAIQEDERSVCLSLSQSHPGIETVPMFRINQHGEFDLNHGLEFAVRLERYELLALLISHQAKLFHYVSPHAYLNYLARYVSDPWWSELADTLQACTPKQFTTLGTFLLHTAPRKFETLGQYFFPKLNETFFQHLGETSQRALALELMRVFHPFLLAHLKHVPNSAALIENVLTGYLQDSSLETDNRRVILKLIDFLNRHAQMLSPVTLNLAHEFISNQFNSARLLYEQAFAELFRTSSPGLQIASDSELIVQRRPQHSPLFTFSPLARSLHPPRLALNIDIPDSEDFDITLLEEDCSLASSPTTRSL